MRALTCFVFLLAAFATNAESKTESVRISRTDKSIELPKSLVEKIKKEFLDHQKKIDPAAETTVSDYLNKVLRRYLSIEFEIWSESNLLRRNILFEIPKGGGVIDFQSILPTVPGKFLARIALKKNGVDISQSKDVKVYFVSNSVIRKIEKESFGNGCDTYYDVTNFFKDHLAKGEASFFTKDQRYLSFLAGTYVFTLVGNDEINIATLSFEDSRFSKLQCRKL